MLYPVFSHVWKDLNYIGFLRYEVKFDVLLNIGVVHERIES